MRALRLPVDYPTGRIQFLETSSKHQYQLPGADSVSRSVGEATQSGLTPCQVQASSPPKITADHDAPLVRRSVPIAVLSLTKNCGHIAAM